MLLDSLHIHASEHVYRHMHVVIDADILIRFLWHPFKNCSLHGCIFFRSQNLSNVKTNFDKN